jgi:hypothetical protein
LLVALLLAFPAASALACAEMLAGEDDCPMEHEGTQPAPAPAKMKCCYVSATEPATGTAPVKLHKVVADAVPSVAEAPAPEVAPQPSFALHGLSPGQSSSLQQLYCVFLI